MAKVGGNSGRSRKVRPGLTPEAREKQIIGEAYDRVEQRILDGTASSQELVFFLKLGSSMANLEKEKLEEENKLLRAKTESLESEKRIEKLYEDAIRQMKIYSGADDEA